MIRHYASDRYSFLATVGGASVVVVTLRFLPDEALTVAGTIVKSLWIVLGPIGAFCIQLLLQLLTLGEDKNLKAREQIRLSKIVDERVRYLWDLTATAVLALLVCLAAGSVDADSQYLRTLISTATGLAVWTGTLAARLPRLYSEIRSFRWRLARERNEADMRVAELAALKPMEKPPHVPEVIHRNDP